MRRFSRTLFAVLALGGASLLAANQTASAADPQRWSFEGPLGTFDRASLQRGFQVYQQACAACHALSHLRYGDLEGIGLSNHQAAAVAANAMVPGGYDANGLAVLRPGIASDFFHDPWPNPQAARAASNGAYPVDLALITRQRPGGADYVYRLLTGYGDAPPGAAMFNNRNWNDAFPGNQIAMANPLRAGQMTFADGTKATVPEMSRDVATFLAWASDPSLEERRITGVQVILFLAFLTLLTYLLKRRIWTGLPRD
jgi:ubiquinol-cytochrome c reductase cytochrome c1 subunit